MTSTFQSFFKNIKEVIVIINDLYNLLFDKPITELSISLHKL